MKTLTLIFVISLFSIHLSAQRIVEESLPVSSNQEIKLEFDFADDITVTSWDKQEVYVKATVNINDGKDNSKFKFISRKGSGYISIKSEIENLEKLTCRTIIIEDGDTTFVNGRGADMDLSFEVFMPSNKELQLETINGDITIKGLKGPMDIKTINGEIDLYLESNQKADLAMSTINGTMYTNLDLEFSSNKGNICRIGGNVDTKLNGGGVDIDLETINGTIYLRNSK